MNNATNVTVILTSFNHERFIGEAIESVLQQSFQNFELIIADDRSTDRSWEIIKRYKDPRIQLFKSESNERGLINKILKSGMVHGNYVAIHHSDDAWEPTKLAKQVTILDERPEVGAVFTRATIIDGNGIAFQENEKLDPTTRAYMSIFNQENRSRYSWLNRFFFNGNCLCHPSVLVRRECYDTLGQYNLFYRQIPDFDFWIRLCLKYEIYILEEKLVRFRIIEKSQNTSSQTPESLRRNSFEFLHTLANYAQINDSDEMLKIFPELKVYENQGKIVPAYALARMAIESKSSDLKHFGLFLLGSRMKEESFRDECQMKHGFQLSEFHKITGSQSIF